MATHLPRWHGWQAAHSMCVRRALFKAFQALFRARRSQFLDRLPGVCKYPSQTRWSLPGEPRCLQPKTEELLRVRSRCWLRALVGGVEEQVPEDCRPRGPGTVNNDCLPLVSPYWSHPSIHPSIYLPILCAVIYMYTYICTYTFPRHERNPRCERRRHVGISKGSALVLPAR